MKSLPSLSTLIIARNEEETIRSCVGAAIAAMRSAHDAGLAIPREVVLADSASTDQTVAIAKEFPITIVCLPATWPLSASAGRYVGGKFVTGDLVLYLDGDYVVRSDWLRSALKLLGDESIAGVTGTDIERFPGTSVLERRLWEWTQQGAPAAASDEVEVIAVGVLRRSAVLEVGDFHPYLRGAEDRDLGYRLALKGYRFLRTREPMGDHYWADSRDTFGYVTYYRSVAYWSYGEGQACRARFGDRQMRRKYLSRYGTARYLINLDLGAWLLTLGTLNSGAVFLPALLGPLAVLADVVALGVLAGRKYARRLSWRDVFFELAVIPYTIIRFAAFSAGFLRGAPDPRGYPTRPPVIQSGVPQIGTIQK